MPEEMIEVNCSTRTVTRRELTKDELKSRVNKQAQEAKERKLEEQRGYRARKNLEKIAETAGITVSELKEALKDA